MPIPSKWEHCSGGFDLPPPRRKAIFVPGWQGNRNLLSKPVEEVTVESNDSFERCNFEGQISFKSFDLPDSADESNEGPGEAVPKDSAFDMKSVRDSLPKILIRLPERIHDESSGAFSVFKRGEGPPASFRPLGPKPLMEKEVPVVVVTGEEREEETSICSVDTSRSSLEPQPKKLFDPLVHRPGSGAVRRVEPAGIGRHGNSTSAPPAETPTVGKREMKTPTAGRSCSSSTATLRLVFPSPSKATDRNVVASSSHFGERLMRDLSALRMNGCRPAPVDPRGVRTGRERTPSAGRKRAIVETGDGRPCRTKRSCTEDRYRTSEVQNKPPTGATGLGKAPSVVGRARNPLTAIPFGNVRESQSNPVLSMTCRNDGGGRTRPGGRRGRIGAPTSRQRSETPRRPAPSRSRVVLRSERKFDQ